MSSIREIVKLIKYKIAIAITFTTTTGFILFERGVNFNLIWAVLGVFCLSSGAMALNQLQERNYDSRMHRTSTRPLPSGKMNPGQVIFWVVFFLLAGIIILYLFLPPITLLLGLFNVIWYNAVYTPLKRITPFAVVPGSIIGAVPALIGWAAAGGNILDFQIWVVAIFLFLWQIPHFWLILHYYNDDYEKGGFPGIERVFSQENIKYIIFVWVLATSFSSFLFPIVGLITQPLLVAGLIAANLSLIYLFSRQLIKKRTAQKTISFASINIYMIVVLCFTLVNLFFR
jgi:protoheme IX farnesyltransferase